MAKSIGSAVEQQSFLGCVDARKASNECRFCCIAAEVGNLLYGDGHVTVNLTYAVRLAEVSPLLMNP